MQALLSRDSLLGILARLLREDGRKSLELAGALASCFYCLSAFSQLQRPLLDHQVRLHASLASGVSAGSGFR